MRVAVDENKEKNDLKRKLVRLQAKNRRKAEAHQFTPPSVPNALGYWGVNEKREISLLERKRFEMGSHWVPTPAENRGFKKTLWETRKKVLSSLDSDNANLQIQLETDKLLSELLEKQYDPAVIESRYDELKQ